MFFHSMHPIVPYNLKKPGYAVGFRMREHNYGFVLQFPLGSAFDESSKQLVDYAIANPYYSTL